MLHLFDCPISYSGSYITSRTLIRLAIGEKSCDKRKMCRTDSDGPEFGSVVCPEGIVRTMTTKGRRGGQGGEADLHGTNLNPNAPIMCALHGFLCKSSNFG